MIDIKDEIRVWRTLTWPFIKQEARKDLRRVKHYYLGMLPFPIMSLILERELRRELEQSQ